VGSGGIWCDLVGSGGIWWLVGSFDSTRSQKLVGSAVESFDSTNFPKFPPVAVYRWKSAESTKIGCRVGSGKGAQQDQLEQQVEQKTHRDALNFSLKWVQSLLHLCTRPEEERRA
jgi:hypothetical protein